MFEDNTPLLGDRSERWKEGEEEDPGPLDTLPAGGHISSYLTYL